MQNNCLSYAGNVSYFWITYIITTSTLVMTMQFYLLCKIYIRNAAPKNDFQVRFFKKETIFIVKEFLLRIFYYCYHWKNQLALLAFEFWDRFWQMLHAMSIQKSIKEKNRILLNRKFYCSFCKICLFLFCFSFFFQSIFF